MERPVELEALRGPRQSAPPIRVADQAGGAAHRGPGSAGAVVIKIIGYRSGRSQTKASLRYIARAGPESESTGAPSDRDRVGVETDLSERLSAPQDLARLVDDWAAGFGRPRGRDAMHVVISFPRRVDPTTAQAIAAAALPELSDGRPFAFAVHQDTGHAHVHALIRMRDGQGKSLWTNRGVLADWRALVAARARERGIHLDPRTRRERGLAPSPMRAWEAAIIARGRTPRLWVETAREVATGARPLSDSTRARFADQPEAAGRAFAAAGWSLLAQARADPNNAQAAEAAAVRAARLARQFDPASAEMILRALAERTSAQRAARWTDRDIDRDD